MVEWIKNVKIKKINSVDKVWISMYIISAYAQNLI